MISSSESLRSIVPDLAGTPSPQRLVRMRPWEFPIPHGRPDRVHPVEGQTHRNLSGRLGNPPRRPRLRVRPGYRRRKGHSLQARRPMIRDLHIPSGDQFTNSLKRSAHRTSGQDTTLHSEMLSDMRYRIYSRLFDLKHVDGVCQDCDHDSRYYKSRRRQIRRL